MRIRTPLLPVLLVSGAQAFVSLSVVAQRRTAVSRMVADTPEAVVEEASTQSVLDRILDESLRTSARRPIMIQFSPSSKAVRTHSRLFHEASLIVFDRSGGIGKEPSFRKPGKRP